MIYLIAVVAQYCHGLDFHNFITEVCKLIHKFFRGGMSRILSFRVVMKYLLGDLVQLPRIPRVFPDFTSVVVFLCRLKKIIPNMTLVFKRYIILMRQSLLGFPLKSPPFMLGIIDLCSVPYCRWTLNDGVQFIGGMLICNMKML